MDSINVPWKQKFEQKNCCALLERGHELIEPGIETERENRKDSFVLFDFQISGDNQASSHDIGMAQHDAFRFAGGPRRVQNGGSIFVNGPFIRILERGKLSEFLQLKAKHRDLLGFAFPGPNDKS